jgi:hypothetical protein
VSFRSMVLSVLRMWGSCQMNVTRVESVPLNLNSGRRTAAHPEISSLAVMAEDYQRHPRLDIHRIMHTWYIWYRVYQVYTKRSARLTILEATPNGSRTRTPDPDDGRTQVGDQRNICAQGPAMMQ